MALLQQNDILFAHKALNLMPRLSATTRRVAGAIIDSFNKKTGQCDPSIGGLMKQLNVSRAAVIRATDELDKLGLIRKDIHGGFSHRNAYLPNWDQLRKFVEDWDREKRARSIAKRAKSKVSKLQPSQPQTCDSDGLRNETQTLLTNKSNKPIEETDAPSSPPKSTARNKIKSPEENFESKTLATKAQRTFLLPLKGGKDTSRNKVAREAAQHRWEADALSLGEHVYEAIAVWITDETNSAAVEAELSKSGGGLEFIMKAMGGERRNALG
jgi:DNA-binding transcriptional MocR family regulator